MDQNKYIDDLKDIREIMNRSSRFISLSGLSGVFAGIIALIGAYFAYQTVYSNQDYLGYRVAILTTRTILQLVLIACSTALLAFIAGIYFTTRQAKKQKQKIWDHQSKRLLANLAIPLLTGGILCLLLLFRGYIGLIAPLTLVFYGLALVNASKYTLREIHSLGLMEVVLGLTGIYFIGYGLIFWSIGFGLLHIIYGIVMHLKYRL